MGNSIVSCWYRIYTVRTIFFFEGGMINLSLCTLITFGKERKRLLVCESSLYVFLI
jgi:hypothetical protein